MALLLLELLALFIMQSDVMVDAASILVQDMVTNMKENSLQIEVVTWSHIIVTALTTTEPLVDLMHGLVNVYQGIDDGSAVCWRH